MTQLVGQMCRVCKLKIVSVLDAEFCGACGGPVHLDCQQSNEPFRSDDPYCRCGSGLTPELPIGGTDGNKLVRIDDANRADTAAATSESVVLTVDANGCRSFLARCVHVIIAVALLPSLVLCVVNGLALLGWSSSTFGAPGVILAMLFWLFTGVVLFAKAVDDNLSLLWMPVLIQYVVAAALWWIGPP